MMEEATINLPKRTNSLSETLYQFQQQRYLCDVLIFTSDGYIPAHRVILVAASKHFRDIESNHTTPEANFYLTQEKSEDLHKIMKLIYTGILNINTENITRIQHLCQMLGLEDAEKECNIFVEKFSSFLDKQSENVEQFSDTSDSTLSLRQLEAEVINVLEKSRYNNTPNSSGTYNETESDPIVVDHVDDIERKDVIISDVSLAQKDEVPDKTIKVKGPRTRHGKAKLISTLKSKVNIANPPEKLINCSLCKEKFHEKKQLLEHRRKKHLNKRKPIHTKRYVPNNDYVENSDNEEDTSSSVIEGSSARDVSNETESFSSTRQGTRRVIAENHTKLKKSNKIICRLCKDEFQTNDLLVEHRKQLHPGTKRENLTCNLCEKVLSSWLNLVEHKYKKHGVQYDTEKYQILKCAEADCDFSTIVEYKLKTHYSDVHGEMGSFLCDICEKACKSAPQLKYHMKTVHSENSSSVFYKCDQCGKSFRHACNLKKHIDFVHLKIHDKKYLCHLCTYKCMSKTDLHNHLLKIHDIPLPKSCKVYKCDKCDYFTLTRSCYDRHMQLHQENGLQKTFMCSTCGKGFYNIQNVKAHEKRHKSEILNCPFEGCSYSTKFKHTMKNHIAGMHTHKNLRPFQCHLCEYSCKLKGNLDKHLRGKHGVEVMTIPKLRQKAIETGSGFSDIVFPPRNCNEMPAKLADKHQLQMPQKSQELQDVTLPQLVEMAKKVSKELNESSTYQNKSGNDDNPTNEIMYNSNQMSSVSGIPEVQMEPVSSVTMDTEGSAYNQEQEVALSNLNPVPLHVNKTTGKDSVYSQSGEEQSSYGAQNLMYDNTDTYQSRALTSHLSQPNVSSAESYTAMLSSFLNQKGGSQLSPHQSIPNLLSLNMQNYQSHGQPHPMVLHHLLAQMGEETGSYSSAMSRPTPVPLNDSATFSAQMRPGSVENMTFRNSNFQGQEQYDQSISQSNDGVGYHHSNHNNTATHHSPTPHRGYYGGVGVDTTEGRGSPKQKP